MSKLNLWVLRFYAGFAASEVLADENNKVYGVATGETGVLKDGTHGPEYDPGMELHAKLTIVAEGCRGSVSRVLIDKYDLAKDSAPQTYGLGIKEIWEVSPEQHSEG